MTRTPPAPRPPATYEGRLLPRPHDEVQDQGLGFDLVTMLGRRRLLQLVGLGGAAAGLAACGTSSTGTASRASSPAATTEATSSTATAVDASSSATGTEIPEETAGPYPGDGSNGPDVLGLSGVVRSDIRSSFAGSSGTAEGVPMTLTLSVTDLARDGRPYEGVAVYVWHCDREGRYSLYSDGVTDQNYLRGVQVADASGQVTFTSVFPACYSGRWPHVHFEVYPDLPSVTDAGGAIATSQVALPQSVCEAVYATSGYEASVATLSQVSLARDNVFGDDAGVHQLGTVTGSVSSGLRVALTVPVDATT